MKSITWPAWFNSPDGKNAAIFAAASEVPSGWTSGAEKQTVDGKQAAPTSVKVEASTVEFDAAGHPFDPALHTGTKTKAGLWRMKPGVTRPDLSLDL